MNTVQEIVQARGIKCLWHFTKLENLHSILDRGIIPRSVLECEQSNVTFNDAYRWDNQKNANCLSIGHPNYKMFYRLRQENQNQEWVVIACKPDMLWEKDCAFCNDNAASNSVTYIPINSRKTVSAFKNIFEPIAGKSTRRELNLPDNYPTNPQAEVLVFNIIEPAYILGVVCSSDMRKIDLETRYVGFKFIKSYSQFSYRHDFSHW